MAKRAGEKCDKLLEDDEEEIEIKRLKEEETEEILPEEVADSVGAANADPEHTLDSQGVETEAIAVTEDTVSETEVSVVETLQESQMVDGVVQDIQVEQLASFSEAPEAPAFQNIIVQHMEITEPLTTLRRLLEQRLSCSLAEHEFYLQDSLQLDPAKNLVEQCVQGEGMVQINVEVKSQPGQKPKINIVDILKPAEEQESQPTVQQVQEPDHVTRWIVDQSFRREQDRLKIPFDPCEWNDTHVKHWIQWAIKEFGLEGVDPENFNITGKQLCELQHVDFIKLVPNDRNDVFWTHLELLRKCKFVAVVQQPAPVAVTTVTVSSGVPYDVLTGKTLNKYAKVRTSRIIGDGIGSVGNRSGNNGQIQLWQFLLELLTDRGAREIIQWVSDDGEFKLLNPEAVAQMWGERKHKPTMNYEKLSRALRYYYDGDMIAKVHGKRFVYKFVCDLKSLLGYSASELNRLVEESAAKELQKVRDSLRPGMVRKQSVVMDPVKAITADELMSMGRQ